MREQLRALVKLAEIDANAKDIDEKLKGIPAELEERRGAVAKLQALVERQRAFISEAERLLSQQEIDLASRNDALSKAKAKGAKAKSMREQDAAERELDAVRRSIKDGEAERERLKERIAATRSGLEAPEKALVDAKAELDEAAAASEGRLETLRGDRERVVSGRDEWVRKIDKPVYRTYERLRPKLFPVVTEAVGEVCSSCRMAIAPQRYIQLLKGAELMQCQHCQRYLYHRDSLAD